MIISSKLDISNCIIHNSKNNDTYRLPSLLKAIEEFNQKCPSNGKIFNRHDLMDESEYTHEVHKLWLKEDQIYADIDIKENIDIDINNLSIKPIIITPLHFGSGVISIIAISRVDITEAI